MCKLNNYLIHYDWICLLYYYIYQDNNDFNKMATVSLSWPVLSACLAALMRVCCWWLVLLAVMLFKMVLIVVSTLTILLMLCYMLDRIAYNYCILCALVLYCCYRWYIASYCCCTCWYLTSIIMIVLGDIGAHQLL